MNHVNDKTMNIKNTFLYFWCFLANKDESNNWYEGNNFSKIIHAFLMIIGLCGLYVITNIGMVATGMFGDLIIANDTCLSFDYFSDHPVGWWLICSIMGMFFLVGYFLIFLFMTVITAPLITIIVAILLCIIPLIHNTLSSRHTSLVLNSMEEIPDTSKNKLTSRKQIETSNSEDLSLPNDEGNSITSYINKIICSILLIILMPLALYGFPLLGFVYESIFYSDRMLCNLDSYHSLMSGKCLTGGTIAGFIIIGIYVGIAICIGILFGIKRFYDYCRNVQNEYEINQEKTSLLQVV